MDDLNSLFALYREPEIRRYFPERVLNHEETKEELEWFLNGHPEHPELEVWATIHKETGKFIGRRGLLPWIIEGQNKVEIVYLLDKTFWKQGFSGGFSIFAGKHGTKEIRIDRYAQSRFGKGLTGPSGHKDSRFHSSNHVN